jgi:hypothetical protein
MEHIINETIHFTYIKFDGNRVYNYATSTLDVKVALKELKLFKKIVNAEKKQISNQLRDLRSKATNIKGVISLPSNKILSWARFGIRASQAVKTAPLEQWKSFWNNVLLECDRIQIQLEKL